VRDVQDRFKRQVATATIEGATLEERLDRVIDVLAQHYEDPSFFVEVQILLDLSVNPGMSLDARDALRRRAVPDFGVIVQPLFAQALGPAASEPDLVAYAFAMMVGHLESLQIARLAGELPDVTSTRVMLVRGIAAVIREESARRGLSPQVAEERP
jgi:hypothetical protein